MVLFAALFLLAAVIVEFSRARRARGGKARGGMMLKRNDFRVVQYAYDDFSIRIWFSNHDVFEYTREQVGLYVFNQLISLHPYPTFLN